MSKLTTACFLLALTGCISAQFTHPAPWELAHKGRSKRISCTVDESVTLSSTPIHWYRAQPGQALKRIMYFAAGASSSTADSEFSETFRFNGGKKDKTFSLTIIGLFEEDAATYYCALWRGDTVTSYPFRVVQKPRASFL